MFALDRYLEDRRRVIQEALRARMPPEDEPPRALHSAMRYAAFSGGKRLRPILCLAAAEAVGSEAEAALLPALAVEVFHAYTLVHDDLPVMDNDELRRGKPTCHVVFGEANAILAGDALLTLAFEWLAASPAPPPYQPHQYVLELATAGGRRGVLAGQWEDLAAEGEEPTAERVEYIHRHKTAALIRAALRLGAIAGGADGTELESLSRYGHSVGLAFQIADDLLNATSSAAVIGKSTGSDERRSKTTYVSVFGVDEARRRAETLVEEAVGTLRNLRGNAQPLAALARYIVERTH